MVKINVSSCDNKILLMLEYHIIPISFTPFVACVVKRDWYDLFRHNSGDWSISTISLILTYFRSLNGEKFENFKWMQILEHEGWNAFSSEFREEKLKSL